MVLGLSAVTTTGTHAAVMLGSGDSFTSGVDGWGQGGTVANVPTWTGDSSWDGSPGHLINTSDGSGAGGKFLMFNSSSSWTGDYLAAGVTAIEMQVDNRTGILNTVPLRVAFNGAGGWFMSDAILIEDSTAGADWQKISFSITSSNLSWVTGGSNDYNATFSGVTNFEILINESGSTSEGSGFLRGDEIVADLRFDDIRAVPEPSSTLLIGLGALVFAGIRRRNQ